jgi:hypothetical protein
VKKLAALLALLAAVGCDDSTAPSTPWFGTYVLHESYADSGVRWTKDFTIALLAERGTGTGTWRCDYDYFLGVYEVDSITGGGGYADTTRWWLDPDSPCWYQPWVDTTMYIGGLANYEFVRIRPGEPRYYDRGTGPFFERWYPDSTWSSIRFRGDNGLEEILTRR